jgi:hypothetical protein
MRKRSREVARGLTQAGRVAVHDRYCDTTRFHVPLARKRTRQPDGSMVRVAQVRRSVLRDGGNGDCAAVGAVLAQASSLKLNHLQTYGCSAL